MNQRTEFSNLAIVGVVLREFTRPFITELEHYCESPEEKLEAVRNAALDLGNDEVVAMCDYIESKGLILTFFPD